MDIEGLSSLGYEVNGWDPAFHPHGKKSEADVVNLGYVLNVIEDPGERILALRTAFALARKVLIVSTLVSGQETAAHKNSLGDGFLTKSNTFQKFYAPGELESLIEETLGIEAITLSFGICIAFKDPDEAEAFQSMRNRRRLDWSQIGTQLAFSSPISRERKLLDRYDLHRNLFDDFWQCLLDLGRAPEPGEFDQMAEIRRAGGGLSKAVALTVNKNGEPLWNHARKIRSEDVLVYLAMMNFRKKFVRREIPVRIKNDIKAFFGDLNRAKELARDILFSAGDSDEIELAVDELKFGIFDRDEMQFTFHRSYLNQLPPVLRVYVQCGAIRFGNPEEADLIKIHIRSGKLTFLHYDDFEKKKEPILLTRIKINLRTQFVQVFDHSEERQPLPNKVVFWNRKPA
jgi:DNA phosphorothioation-associated putative methyltransferase